MRKTVIITSILIVLSTLISNAQSSTNSPFSRFGLGEFTQFQTPYNLAQGGVFSSLRSPANINIANPASYTATRNQSFLLEFGLQNKNSLYKEAGNEVYTGDGNLSYFAAQFPVTKWWSASFGLIPYSVLGYNITHNESISDIDSTQIIYHGNGGLNAVYIGNSFELFKRISIGINANFLYGSSKTLSTATVFSDNFQSTLINTKAAYFHQFNYRIGVQYYDTLFKDISIVLGGTFENKTDLKASSNYNSINYLLINGMQFSDTLNFVEADEQLVELPQYFSGGLSIKKGKKLTLSADYYLRDWKNAFFLDENISSYNTEYGYALGSEIIPSLGAPQIWRNIRYRFGVYYKQTNININNNPLLDYGIGFGVGIPIKVSSTIVNFTVNMGKRSTYEPNTLEEYYTNIHIDLSLGDVWFIKRKFD
ncbi:MAG: hypothetical protein KAI79_00985 [Bacteroidales bacterium]|nr:hypothetical protein [Bacteroidales bacterium]